MKPTKTKIRRALKALRKLAEDGESHRIQRIAQAMETAIRWATEETVGWPTPDREANLVAKCLLDDEMRDRGMG